MNDKQKWLIVVAVGCISALGIAFIFTPRIELLFDMKFWGFDGDNVITNWTGCVLFGMLCSSITGFFLFKDK